MVDATTLRILNRGPEYLRTRMLHRDTGGILQRRRTKSVADELAESRPHYVRKISIGESHDQEPRSHDQEPRSHDQEPRSHDQGPRSHDQEPGSHDQEPDQRSEVKRTEESDMEQQENTTTAEYEDRRDSEEDDTMANTTGSRTPTFKSLPRRQDSLPVQMRQQESPASDTLHRISSVDVPDHRIPEASGPSESQSQPGLTDPAFLGRQASFTRSRPKIPTIATLEYKDNGDACSSDTDKKSNASSHHKLDNNGSPSGGGGGCVGCGGGVVVRRRHRKMISRSRSDLTKRLSNSSDLSELGFRLSRNSADLERFFNEMGLERDILQPMLSSQYAAAAAAAVQWPSVYESVSCIASPDNHSLCSGKSVECCCNNSDRNNTAIFAGEEIRSLDAMSVVERNARIIKWLGGVKKAAGSASD